MTIPAVWCETESPEAANRVSAATEPARRICEETRGISDLTPWSPRGLYKINGVPAPAERVRAGSNRIRMGIENRSH